MALPMQMRWSEAGGLANAQDELRNCAAADVELVFPTGAEVLLVQPTLAVLPAPRLCDGYNPTPCRPDRTPRRQPAAETKATVSCRSPSTRLA